MPHTMRRRALTHTGGERGGTASFCPVPFSPQCTAHFTSPPLPASLQVPKRMDTRNLTAHELRLVCDIMSVSNHQREDKMNRQENDFSAISVDRKGDIEVGGQLPDIEVATYRRHRGDIEVGSCLT